MKSFSGSMVFFVLFSMPALAQSQEGAESIKDSLVLLKTDHFDAAAEARVVAPLVNAETVAVVHVDFSRVAIEPIAAWAGRILGESGGELPKPSQEMAKQVDAFRRAGGKDFYAVVSLGGEGLVPRVRIMVPIDPHKDEKALRATLGIHPDSIRRVGDTLVIRSNYRTPSTTEFPPAERPELTAALAAAGDAPVQAVLIPPASARRVIEELVPQLPKEVDDGPGTVLTHGITWVAASMDLPPQAALRVVVKSQDAQAARMLQAKWLAVLTFCREEAGKNLSKWQIPPRFEKLAALLTPKLENDRLTLTLDEKDHAISELLSLLRPSVESARGAAGAIDAQTPTNLPGHAQLPCRLQALPCAGQLRSQRPAAIELAGTHLAVPRSGATLPAVPPR
jgi:hypothetical protein